MRTAIMRSCDLNAPGWRLLGAFPDHEPNDVGAWLLHNGAVDHGEAILLEIPPGLTPDVVKAGLAELNRTLVFVTASHTHEDHLDPDAWNDLIDAFPDAEFRCPSEFRGDTSIDLAGEPVWFVKAPKHSWHDVVTIFRGVAMTGDIETGMIASVNREVPTATKVASMAWVADFPKRRGYHVHTTISAHLNSLRRSVDFERLFTI